MKLHRDFGPRLMGFFGFDEESTFVDVPGELGEHFVDGGVVDPNRDAGAGCATTVRLLRLILDGLLPAAPSRCWDGTPLA